VPDLTKSDINITSPYRPASVVAFADYA